VASVMLFEGDPPPYDELLEHIERRLHLVPRYRQKLAFVPLGQGRPRWVDDPHLNLRYHVRSTALPSPGSEEQLRALAGRVFAQQLDRDKPLWEIWLAEGVEGSRSGDSPTGGPGRFAVLGKTHHALVDGISGVDITTVLFDTSPEPAAPADPGERWLPGPLPSRAQLLGEALVERTTVPGEIARTARAVLRAPRRIAEEIRDAAVGVGAMAWAGLNPAPESPYNQPIGPHRRFTWVRTSLADIKAIKDELGGSVNDVVLSIVAGGVGRHLRRRGLKTDGLELKAMVPVSVRSDLERGQLGNMVAAIMAPLPVWCQEPVARLDIVREQMKGLKEGGQAVGAQVLTGMSGFAPPTVMSQAARLMSRQRFFNLVVTNVPGPQFSLYLMGRRMIEPFPMVPLAKNQGLGIALMSYDGRMNFGLNGDYDVMWDIEDFAEDLELSLTELADAAGVKLSEQPAVRESETSPT
jgi:diacylglycerol O-acyltransferase / wax synthase